ncbi:MAG: fimbrillin family protein, partial [Muribaculaceae bacterium]
MTNCKKLKTIAILFSLALTTACNDSNNEVLTVDQKMSFDVIPDELDIIIDKDTPNKAAANAVHSQENIEGTNYILHTIIESKSIDAEPSSRAFVSTLDGLKASGFTLNSIVTENATGKKHLYMRDTPVTYNGSDWIYSPIRYWPDISIYKTVFYAFRTSDFDSSIYEGDNMLPTMKYTVPVDPTAQKDIITALHDKNDRDIVKLQFKHRMTSVRIKTRNIDRPIIRLEFSGIYDDGTFDLNTMTWSNVKFSDSNPNGDFKYYFVGSQLLGESSGTEAYVPDENGSDYYFMMLPQDLSAAGRNAKVKVLFDNGTIITAPLKTNWEAGKSVTYLFTYDNVTHQWLDDSNCYLINPVNTSNKKDVNLFAIPISYRINTFWQNEGGGIKPIDAGTEYVAEVIWQDADQRYIYLTDKDGTSSSDSYSATVPSDGGDNECIYFKLSNANFSGTCNIVLGVRRNSESTYLWSWHLWLTEYYPIPESIYKLTNAARVPVRNGTIERYDDPKNASEQVWGSMSYRYRYLMDRNIGAVGAADGSNSTTYENSFGVYYQFGRKDPFPRNGKIYKIDGSFLGEITATDATLIAPADGNKKIPFNGVDDWPVVKTVQYPLEFVTNDMFTPSDHKLNVGNWRNPSWYPAGASIGSKSFYDPCPPGWKLPYGNIFNVFSNNQTFTGNTITVTSESKLTDGEDPIGIRFRISTANPSLT